MKPSISRDRAIALIWTLLGIAAVSILVLAVFALSISQNRRAIARHAEVLTGTLVDAAFAEVQAKLVDGFAEQHRSGAEELRQASVTAAPGLLEVLRYDVPLNRGDELG